MQNPHEQATGAPFFGPRFLEIITGRGLDAPADPTPGCPLGHCNDDETCSETGRCCATANWHTPVRCSACGHAYDAAACAEGACPACGAELVRLQVVTVRNGNVGTHPGYTALMASDTPNRFLGMAVDAHTREAAFAARCTALHAAHPSVNLHFTHAPDGI